MAMLVLSDSQLLFVSTLTDNNYNQQFGYGSPFPKLAKFVEGVTKKPQFEEMYLG